MYELVSPINPHAMLKYMGYFLIVFAVVLIAPVLAALAFGETETAIIYGITAFVCIIMGFAVYRILPDYELETKEAIILAALVFPLSSFISSIPMSLSAGMPFIDAFFESVSAVTTTGLSVASADISPVFLFIRSWSQWVGGIGIILIVLSVLIRPGTTAFRIYRTQYGESKIRPTVIATTRLLGSVYLGITFIVVILLLLSGMSLFDAICHAFSCVSTGGFSTRPESIAAFKGFLIPLTISISCIMGAISFVLYPEMIKNPKELFNNLELRYFCLIAGIGILTFAYTLSERTGIIQPLPDATFQVISALTTAGYSTIDLSLLSDSSKGVLSSLMWIGGSIGSTAGGIKIFRLLVLAKLIKLVFIRLFLPREAITPLMIKDHVIESDEVYQLTTFVLLYATVLIVSAYVFMLHGVDTGDAIFEVSSALGTVGLSVGVTDAAMPSILKIVLCIDMLLGRIEIIPLLVLVMPRTWTKRTKEVST